MAEVPPPFPEHAHGLGLGRTGPRLVTMGVSGCGKSVVGRLLAERLGVPYADGDDLHPAANVTKMAAGRPLDDEDRAPWLEAVGAWLAGHERGAVVSCSALRRVHRDVLRAAAGDIRFVHLTADRATLERRIAGRRGHFMPASLLGSQLATLEPPAVDEPAVTVDVGGTPSESAARALSLLWA